VDAVRLWQVPSRWFAEMAYSARNQASQVLTCELQHSVPFDNRLSLACCLLIDFACVDARSSKVSTGLAHDRPAVLTRQAQSIDPSTKEPVGRWPSALRSGHKRKLRQNASQGLGSKKRCSAPYPPSPSECVPACADPFRQIDIEDRRSVETRAPRASMKSNPR
jgi:hypothetical protein